MHCRCEIPSVLSPLCLGWVASSSPTGPHRAAVALPSPSELQCFVEIRWVIRWIGFLEGPFTNREDPLGAAESSWLSPVLGSGKTPAFVPGDVNHAFVNTFTASTSHSLGALARRGLCRAIRQPQRGHGRLLPRGCTSAPGLAADGVGGSAVLLRRHHSTCSVKLWFHQVTLFFLLPSFLFKKRGSYQVYLPCFFQRMPWSIRRGMSAALVL